jgi:hypothetical protein
MVKRLFAVAVFALLTAGAYAQVTISGGFALSTVTDPKVTGSGYSGSLDVDTSIGLGGNIYVDYLLPISVPLSLGVEFGVDGATLKYTSPSGEENITAIPLLLRAAYHFDLSPKLDLYAVGKIGYSFGSWTGDARDFYDNMPNVTVGATGGFGWGIDLGISYYFSQLAGLFAEVGFDDYMLETKISGGGSTMTFKTPFNRFLTVGLSLKF